MGKELKPCQRAGLTTAVVTAVSAAVVQIVPPLTALANEVVRWLTDWAETGAVTDLDVEWGVWRSLAVSLLLGLAAGVANWLWRCAQERFAWLPGQRLVGYTDKNKLQPARHAAGNAWPAPKPGGRLGP